MMGWVKGALSGGWKSEVLKKYSQILSPPLILLVGNWPMGDGLADSSSRSMSASSWKQLCIIGWRPEI